MRNLGVVQLRDVAESGGTSLGRRLAGKPLIEWVVRRATESQLLDGVIVVAAETPTLQDVARLIPQDVPVYFGHPTDPLRRLRDAALQYGPESIVRLRADNPFVDPVLIDRLIRTATTTEPTPDYVGYHSRDGRPAILSPLGVCAEWFSVRTLRRLERRLTDPKDRRHMSNYLLRHPDDYRACLIPVPEGLDREDVRLSVDSQEDWEHTQAIFEALDPEQLDWQGIAGFLDQQPALRQRMALLNRGPQEV